MVPVESLVVVVREVVNLGRNRHEDVELLVYHRPAGVGAEVDSRRVGRVELHDHLAPGRNRKQEVFEVDAEVGPHSAVVDVDKHRRVRHVGVADVEREGATNRVAQGGYEIERTRFLVELVDFQ